MDRLVYWSLGQDADRNHLGLVALLDLLVEKKVCVLFLWLIVSKRILLNASERLISEFGQIEVRNPLIVEVMPLVVISADVRGVVTSLCHSIMDHYSFQFVFIVGAVDFVTVDSLSGEGQNVEELGE